MEGRDSQRTRRRRECRSRQHRWLPPRFPRHRRARRGRSPASRSRSTAMHHRSRMCRAGRIDVRSTLQRRCRSIHRPGGCFRATTCATTRRPRRQAGRTASRRSKRTVPASGGRHGGLFVALSIPGLAGACPIECIHLKKTRIDASRRATVRGSSPRSRDSQRMCSASCSIVAWPASRTPASASHTHSSDRSRSYASMVRGASPHSIRQKARNALRRRSDSEGASIGGGHRDGRLAAVAQERCHGGQRTARGRGAPRRPVGAHRLTEPHLPVDAVERCAPVMAAAADPERVLDTREREAATAPWIVEVDVRADGIVGRPERSGASGRGWVVG